MPASATNCVPMAPDPEFPGTSLDAVLGGRLRLRQPLKGHRVGHDAILLAAATAAKAGEHAVELGAGVGAAGLALAMRVAGLRATLIEIEPDLAALATHNAALNGLGGRVVVRACDAGDTAALAKAGLTESCADRVLMNPPFHDAARQNVSPDPRRRLAHVAAPGLLAAWVAAAAWLLKPGGTLTLIWRADGEADVMAALVAEFGSIVVLPVLPGPERPAIRILVRAGKSGRGETARLAPLVLNDGEGRPSRDAEAVLRSAQTLALASP